MKPIIIIPETYLCQHHICDNNKNSENMFCGHLSDSYRMPIKILFLKTEYIPHPFKCKIKYKYLIYIHN